MPRLFDDIIDFGIFASSAPRVPLDANAAAWIALEEAAGYVFSTQQRTGTNTAFLDLKSNNLYTKLFRLQLLCMGTSGRNAIPMIGSGGSFQGGITHNTKSITYNGSTGYFDPNVNASTCGWTVPSLAFGHYISADVGSDNSAIQGIGTFASTDTIQFGTRFSGNGSFFDVPTDSISGRLTGASNGSKGLRSYQRYSNSSARITLYNGSQTTVASKTNITGTGSLPNLNFFFGARNFNGSADSFSTESHGLVWAGTGMSTGDLNLLEVILYNLLIAFGAT